jgi:hypothetical protein
LLRAREQFVNFVGNRFWRCCAAAEEWHTTATHLLRVGVDINTIVDGATILAQP